MRSNRGIFWYSLGLTLLLLLPMVLTVAFFTDQYQKQQLLRQASAADSTLHIEPGAQGVYTLLLVVQQEEPAFVLARADGPHRRPPKQKFANFEDYLAAHGGMTVPLPPEASDAADTPETVNPAEAAE